MAPLLIMVMVFLPGCTPPCIEKTVLSGPGSQIVSLRTDGQEREYLLHLPPDAFRSRRLPLVVIFHGYASGARSMEGVTGMSDKADKQGFIAVYPQATGFIRTSWNADFCCGDAYLKGIDDLKFFQDLLASLRLHLQIDDARIYVAGFSNGAMMAYYLASQMPDDIAAIAVVAGAAGVLPVESSHALTIPHPSAPVALIGFHGLKDRHIPYAGGEGKRTGGILEFISVDRSLGFWIRANRCNPEPAREALQEGAVLKESYTCHDHADVVFYTIRDGGHDWPEEGACGRSGDCISATDLIWEFFLAHPKKR